MEILILRIVKIIHVFFCAFEGIEGEIVISDPFLQRIILYYPEAQDIIYKYFENNSFPRWIIPFKNRYFFVDRNSNEIGFMDKAGNIVKRCIPDMENLISASIGYDEKLLVCGRGKTPVIKIDDDLNILDVFFDSSRNFQSVQEIECGKFLISDIGKNIVCICDKKGTVYWQHGVEYMPGNDHDNLLAPKYACINGKKVYIADTKNNRIKIVDISSNSSRCIYGDEFSKLWYPTCINVLNNNDMLITDCLNQRVIRISDSGKRIWQFGFSFFTPIHIFKSPRMIEIVDNEIYVINAYGNNIVKIFGEELQEQKIYENIDLQLFWPKGIRKYQKDYYIISDSRNGRILIVDEEMKLYRSLNNLQSESEHIKLCDPHDVDVDVDGNFVITDAGSNMIYLTDSYGKIIWEYGVNGELMDPHQCRLMDDGNYMIVDSGHNRIIFVNRLGETVEQISELNGSSLKKPRWCEKIGEKIYLIADTGNNRVIITNSKRKVVFEYGGKWGSGIYAMRQPRCVKLYNNKIVVSDTDNNRVIVLEGVDELNYKVSATE